VILALFKKRWHTIPVTILTRLNLFAMNKRTLSSESFEILRSKVMGFQASTWHFAYDSWTNRSYGTVPDDVVIQDLLFGGDLQLFHGNT
jgi:hypothetical protein